MYIWLQNLKLLVMGVVVIMSPTHIQVSLGSINKKRRFEMIVSCVKVNPSALTYSKRVYQFGISQPKGQGMVRYYDW